MPESLTHSGCVCKKKKKGWMHFIHQNTNNKLGDQILLNMKTKYSSSCHLNNNSKKVHKT